MKEKYTMHYYIIYMSFHRFILLHIYMVGNKDGILFASPPSNSNSYSHSYSYSYFELAGLFTAGLIAGCFVTIAITKSSSTTSITSTSSSSSSGGGGGDRGDRGGGWGLFDKNRSCFGYESLTPTTASASASASASSVYKPVGTNDDAGDVTDDDATVATNLGYQSYDNEVTVYKASKLGYQAFDKSKDKDIRF